MRTAMKITASTPVYAVLGHPIRHSLSPVMHNSWIAEFGYRGVYVAFDVSADHIEQTLDGLLYAGLQGGNITSPLKERAAAYLSSCSARASAIGSVNLFARDGATFQGDSTDGDGFLTDLDCRAPGWREIGGHIVILGAGGAARAILYALHHAGKRGLHIVNRNVERAKATAAIVDDASIIIQQWDNISASLKDAGLVINVTSAGVDGSKAIAPDFMQTSMDCLVYDSVYAPGGSAFLEAARRDKRAHLGGLGMLVGQGALAFERWFGVRPDLLSGLARLEAAAKT
jgi:shikimate dehydrogenase